MPDPFDFRRQPPPEKQGELADMAPYVRSIATESVSKGRGKGRTILWSIWIALVVLAWLMRLATDVASLARGGNPQEVVVTLTDIRTLLGSFFFFYAIDRIIG